MNWTGKTIAFLGDSITAGAAASSEDRVYHQCLKRMLGLSETLIYGKGGTRIARQKTPSDEPAYDEDFNQRADGMAPGADLVVVFGGTNDFGHGDAPIGKYGDNTPDTFFGACYTLFEKLAGRYGKEKILIITPLHRVGEENVFGEGNKKEAGEVLCRYVEALKTTARHLNLQVLNLWDDRDLNPNIKENQKNFSGDGLHPSDEGHRLIAEKLAAYLLRL